MEATDVAPSRLVAAREAAHKFIEVVPAGVRVSLVAFDQAARVIIPPTTSKTVLDRAVDRLSLGEEQRSGRPSIPPSTYSPRTPPRMPKRRAVARIVLMSDGETTMGRPDAQAAREARIRSVKVNTIAFGTDHGSVTVDSMPVQVPVDRQALHAIADVTGGKAFDAASAEEIVSVFEDLGHGVGRGPSHARSPMVSPLLRY